MIFLPRSLKRIVIKVGSNVLTDHLSLKKKFFHHMAEQIEFLQKRKIKPVIVSSGAIAAAMASLKRKTKPKGVPAKQAFAAFGQPLLMDEYMEAFHKRGLRVAQVLLTSLDVKHRDTVTNARHAFEELFRKNIVPIVNENDTVVVEEIKFGDNDMLSALVARLVRADLLLILSHVDGLYDSNPKKNKKSRLIPVVRHIDQNLRSCLFSEKNERSVGGMESKLKAAERCLQANIPVFLTNGCEKDYIRRLLTGKKIKGTYFCPQKFKK